MKIKVRLYGVFRINRFKEQVREYPRSIRVQMIIDELEIPATLLGIVLINGIHANSEDVLNDGDSLMLLPLLEGG